jgi:hypothetical protein
MKFRRYYFLLLCIIFGCATTPEKEVLRHIPRSDRSAMVVLNFKNSTAGDAADKYQPWELGLASLMMTGLERIGRFNLYNDQDVLTATRGLGVIMSGEKIQPNYLKAGQSAKNDGKKSGSLIKLTKPSGKAVLVILESRNDYRDCFEHGCFTRGAYSGAGTGPFMGSGFEFAKGACDALSGRQDADRRWKSRTLGCSERLLDSDWCARLKSDPSVQYTLHFYSWTVGPKRPGQHCEGRCADTNNKTAYLRTRAR